MLLIASEEAINEDLAKRDPSYVYLKRREGGPKGRPSEASLKLFLSSGLILINVWSTKKDKKRKLIGGNIATYPDFLPSRLILVNIWSAYTDRKRKLIGGNNATYPDFLPSCFRNEI